MACNDFPNNPVLDQVYDTGTQEYRWDGFKWVSSGDGGGSGGATEVAVTQVAHGFGTLDCIRWDGAAWVLAQANDPNTTALGVVVEVTDADNFKYAITGAYTVAAHGLAVDQWYYLSETVAGGLDIDEPSAISQPIVYVETATDVSIYAYRPALNADPAAGQKMPLGTLITDASVIFGTTDVEIPMVAGYTQNPDEYFSWDGSGIVILKDCFVDMAFYFGVELDTPADNRSEGMLYIARDGGAINKSRAWSYHRTGSVDRMTNSGGCQFAFVAGERVSMRAQVQWGGPLKIVGNTGQLTLTVIDQEFIRGPAGPQGLDGVGSNPNLLINGGFQICQRSDASIPTWNVGANEYGMDRWYKTSTEEHLRGTDIPNIDKTGLPSAVSAYSLNARKSTQLYLTARQGVELQTIGLPYPFKEQGTYTMSGWFKTLLGEPLNLRGAWVDVVGSVTNRVIDFDEVFEANPPLDEWFFATHTFTLSTVPAATNVAMEFNFSITDTATPNSIMKLHGIKIEEGDTATRFDQPKIADELAICQRYYYKSATNILHGFGYTQTGNSYLNQEHSMRATPTCTVTKGNSNLVNSIAIHSAFPTHINFVCTLATGNSGYVYYEYTAEAEL